MGGSNKENARGPPHTFSGKGKGEGGKGGRGKVEGGAPGVLFI